jgi:hypothetical protein
MNVSFRAGVGFDISGSAGFTAAEYVGLGKPMAISLSGPSFYENIGGEFIDVSAFQDLSFKSGLGVIGANWQGGTYGISLGSKSAFGGSIGLSATSHPIYLYQPKKK